MKTVPLSSGKTIIIASTEGNAFVPGHENVEVGLNACEKKQWGSRMVKVMLEGGALK